MKRIIRIILILIIITIIINLYVILITKNKILDINNINNNDYDCILILGAGVRNNSPSPMLEDRLLTGIELYNKKIAPKILVSGDHEYKNYDEVNVMKNYLIANGIPSENIFMDHAGLSSYDSLYRTKYIFNAKKIIIVTQKYHLHRSLYIAKMLDIDANGVSGSKRAYFGQAKRNIREYFAIIKDFFKTIIKPDSTYMGEVIPINGNGDDTNDTNS